MANTEEQTTQEFRTFVTKCQEEWPGGDGYDTPEEFLEDNDGQPTSFFTLFQNGETPLDAVKIRLREEGHDVA